jgi:rod shape-determining protein MreD
LRLVMLFGLMAVAALFVQTTAPHLFVSSILVPNFIVILAVDLGLRHRSALGAGVAFAMGYATDAFSGPHLGVNAFLITLVFLLTYEVGRRLLVINALVGAIAVFLGVMVTSLGSIMLNGGSDALGQAGPIIPGLMVQALLSAIVAPVIFAILDVLKRGLGLRAGVERE